MRQGSAKSYRVFVRDWWRKAGVGEAEWPDGRVPYPGAPKRTIARHMTYEEAQKCAREYNETHKPGWCSRRAEFEEE
jgi:hypothetical protein